MKNMALIGDNDYETSDEDYSWFEQISRRMHVCIQCCLNSHSVVHIHLTIVLLNKCKINFP